MIKQKNRQHPAVVRKSFSDKSDLARRPVRGFDKRQICLLSLDDENHASKRRHRTRTGQRADGDAAHFSKVQSIAVAQTCLKGRRRRYIRKSTLYVSDKTIVVCAKAE